MRQPASVIITDKRPRKIKDGEVILMGSVEIREDKRLAEDIAGSVAGVKNVENRIRVKLSGI